MEHHDSKYDALIAAARAAGWRIERTSRGHLRFLSPDRRVPPIIGAVSGCPRGYKNLRAYLRRHGVPV